MQVKTSSKMQAWTNHIAIAVDGSGSMSRLKNKVITCFDQLISDLKENARLFKQETRVSTYIFDEKVEVMAFDMNVERLPSIKDFYFVRDSTALAATMNVAIDDLRKVPELYTDHAFLLYILTDGGENASSETDKNKLKTFLKNRPENWTVVAHVPDAQGVRYMEALGMSRENIQIWEVSERGMEKSAELFTSSVKTYMQNRSAGIRSTDTFYATADISNLNSQTIKTELTKINQRSFKLLQNNGLKSMLMKPFVEASLHGYQYVNGACYYEFVKKEPIQANKKVLIRDKKDGVVYGGDDNARALVGFPYHQTAKITPAFSPDYEIFVQSTAPNRSVIPKQRVLVLS